MNTLKEFICVEASINSQVVHNAVVEIQVWCSLPLTEHMAHSQYMCHAHACKFTHTQ